MSIIKRVCTKEGVKEELDDRMKPGRDWRIIKLEIVRGVEGKIRYDKNVRVEMWIEEAPEGCKFISGIKKFDRWCGRPIEWEWDGHWTRFIIAYDSYYDQVSFLSGDRPGRAKIKAKTVDKVVSKGGFFDLVKIEETLEAERIIIISHNDSISFTKPRYTFSIGDEDILYVRVYDGYSFWLVDPSKLKWELVGDIGKIDPLTGKFTALKTGKGVVKVFWDEEKLSAETEVIVR